MARLTLPDLFNTLKEWHQEQIKFLEKYTEHIETLKAATVLANSQQKSWFNAHKWLVVTVAVLIAVLVAPIVMKKNDICQINIKLSESIGFQSCEQETAQTKD